MTEPYRRYICEDCGYIYDERLGDPAAGLAPGTRFEDIPDDWVCPICGARKADMVLMPEAPEGTATAPAANPAAGGAGTDAGVLVIGAGIAGWSVAERLRRACPDRPITMLARCDAAFYHKPALSTALRSERDGRELARVDAHERAAELGIEVVPDTELVAIDRGRRSVLTDRGRFPYEQLVLCLGADQRPIAFPGERPGMVTTVNHLWDYEAFRQRLNDGDHVTLVGAGLIGLEFANDLASAGYHVEVVDKAREVLSALLPPELGARLRQRLELAGVSFHLGREVERLSPAGNGATVVLDSDEDWTTDVVLAATGLVPRTELARNAGLDVGRGIVADRCMRTSDPDIYAVGDCAEVEGRVFSFIEPIRAQAAAAAAAIAGSEDRFEPVPGMIRVKTPALPLAVWPVGSAAGQSVVETALIEAADEGDFLAEFRVGSRLRGFAVAGRYVEQARDLGARVAA